EFWLTYENSEIYNYLSQANDRLKDILENKDTTATKADSLLNKLGDSTKTAKADSLKKKKDTTKKSIAQKLGVDTAKKKEGLGQNEKWEKENPLFVVLRPALLQAEKGYQARPGPVVGYAAIKDTAKVNRYLKIAQIKSIFPRDLKLLWMVKPEKEMPDVLELVALKASGRDGKAALEGDVVIDARQDFGQNNSNEVSMTMNSEGANIWKRLTGENIKKCVAIVLDNYVYSAPVVQDEIPNGRSQITGNFTLNEAKDLANVLKAGKLPAPARIIEEAIVGPTLGKEATNAGFLSFVIAMLLVLAFMIFYYANAGWVANIVLFANFFFIMGILASLGAVLTLPGIAGIVLTMGMAVDANIIIYERVREELAIGKGIRLAIKDGFWNSYSAIIDGHVTSLLTGIILYVFGTGPVKGFATTLIIGIFTTLFTALLMSRLIFERRLNLNKPIKFFTKLTEGAFKNVNIDFIGTRKIMYFISGTIITIGILSLIFRGVDYGIDFTGGRTYVVRFAKEVKTNDLREALRTSFGEAPEVKTFGSNDQVKITTKYLIESTSTDSETKVEQKLYEGLKGTLGNNVSFKTFKEKNVMSSQKVGPTVARDILIAAYWAVFFSLVGISLYIFIRFRRWHFAFGALVSLFHDTMIIVSSFSLLYGILPFSLEIDQAFIAAILTVVGYSIMDTVIIFDRIREYMGLHKKQELKKTTNDALNSTLSRTINTVATVIFTLLAIFIFGGEVIRGFAFALLVGVIIGTYSSLFVATPIFYDTYMRKLRKDERKALKNPMAPAQ
ncbi:MAG: protein translocase subunit SecDF, partial [Bacteroidales bacterium]|nr:protein translocase subunit SecDF [Bacteroidales bacterium]